MLFILISRFSVSFAKFMVFPFLAVYLNHHTELSIVQIGFLIGLSPLASTIFGLVGGLIVDKIGPRYIFMTSLFVNAIFLPGYVLFNNFYMLCLVAIVSGISWNLYNTSSQTLISYTTTEERLPIVFSYSYWAFNLGGSIGPLTGVLLASLDIEIVTFIIFSLILIILSSLTPVFIRKQVSTLEETQEKRKRQTSITAMITRNISFIRMHKVLLFLTLSYFFIFFIESQFESSLVQHIELTEGNGIETIGIMMTIGTVLVLTLQPFAGHVINKFSKNTGLLVGGSLYSSGPILFLFASLSPWFWYAGMVILTLGELVIGPKIQTLIVELSDENKRGTYFSIVGIGGNLAYFLGPITGSFLISNSSITLLLSTMVFVGFFGTFLLVGVSKHKESHTRITENMEHTYSR
nr:MFS transporter [Salimicrobium jeotgali]